VEPTTVECAVNRLAAGALDPQGPVAEAIADLWWLMLGLGVVVFLAFAVLLAVGLWSPPSTDEASARTRVVRWIGWGGVIMPLLVIVVVFAATVYAMRVLPIAAPRDALAIEVVGHQFWYEVHYPDEGVTTTNELHMPVGRPVALQLTSADVIHSFWVPALGGKMDMLPDGTNLLVLQADVPGVHRAQCAEFCGLEHAHMELRVVAEDPEEFVAWVAQQR